MTRAPLVFLDTETTGRLPGRKAWEVGMIRRDPDAAEGSLRMFVDVDVSDAEPGALDIGRYWERHPNGRAASGLRETGEQLYPPRVVAGLVWQWTRGAVVIGCTVNFDTETLAPMLLANGLEPAWDYHILDVTTYAAGWIRGQVAARNLAAPRELEPPYKSTAVAAAIGVDLQPIELAHTALGDADLARRMFDAVSK
jgi:hypothetical protein